jgi:glucan phosphorylase
MHNSSCSALRRYGMFKQLIKDGYQAEVPDIWQLYTCTSTSTLSHAHLLLLCLLLISSGTACSSS